MTRLRLLVVFFAHLVNDIFMNFLAPLLLFLLPTRHFSIEQGASLISVFTMVYALAQPIMGFLVDNRGQRWPIFVGTAWLGTLLSLSGLIHQYWLLLITVGLAGLGTAAFHPQATYVVFRLSPATRRGIIMSLFVAAGNVGWAVAPLVEIPWLKTHGGVTGTAFFIVPALAIGALLFLLLPQTLSKDSAEVIPFSALGQALRQNLRPLVLLVGVVTVRSWVYFSFVGLLPLYFVHQGAPVVVAGRYQALMLFAGAVGALLSGYLSDLYGRRAVIAASLFLVAPCFVMFFHTAGFMAELFLIFGGAFLFASFTLTVTIAQEILPKNVALAGGFTLALGNGMGGLGLAGAGALAQAFGLGTTLQYVALLSLAAAALSFGLPGRVSSLPS